MHEHVGKHAKMQRSKESQTNGTKQARQAERHTKQRKGMHKENQHHKDVFSQVVTPKQAINRTDTTTHKKMAPKTNKHKPTKGTKHSKT